MNASTRIKTEAPLGNLDTSKVPFRIENEDFIPKQRYTSQEFHNLEVEHIWRKTWQVAGREEDVPRPGDYIEYVIATDSILVVRGKDMKIRAFINACRHRATQLGQGCSSFPTGTIVCPFHGWEFDLEGNCTFVYAKDGFKPDMVTPEKTHLRPVKCETKWGMIWVNQDLQAESFDSYAGSLAPNLDPLWMDKMKVRWWKTIHLKANWKAAQEAFFEGYHVMQAHPELILYCAPTDVNMEAQDMLSPRVFFKGGHWAHLNGIVSIGRDEDSNEPPPDLTILKGHPNVDVMIGYNRAMWAGTQSATNQRAVEIQEELLASGVPADDNFPMVLVMKVMEDYAKRGIPYPTPDPLATSWAHVFPNWTFLYGFASILMYRSRPDENDPNKCIFDFWSLEMLPEGSQPKRPVQASDEFFESMWLVHEDKGNIERQQVGLQSNGYEGQRLANTYEETISVMHRQLDQILAAGLAKK